MHVACSLYVAAHRRYRRTSGRGGGGDAPSRLRRRRSRSSGANSIVWSIRPPSRSSTSSPPATTPRQQERCRTSGGRQAPPHPANQGPDSHRARCCAVRDVGVRPWTRAAMSSSSRPIWPGTSLTTSWHRSARRSTSRCCQRTSSRARSERSFRGLGHRWHLGDRATSCGWIRCGHRFALRASACWP